MTQTYSSITKTNLNPNKEQAIILRKNENLSIIDYIDAIEKITDINNITDAYPMSFQRICVFFNSKKIVDEITEKYHNITIKEIEIPIRKLVTGATRLVISIPANIPNEILQTHLEDNNIKLASHINYLKISNDPKYAHIRSGKRQVYVQNNISNQIPETLLIEYQDETYRIFISSDEIKCEICKKFGHKTEKCYKRPNLNDNTSTDNGNKIMQSNEMSQESPSLLNKRHNLNENTPTDNRSKIVQSNVTPSPSLPTLDLPNKSNDISGDINKSRKKRNAAESPEGSTYCTQEGGKKRTAIKHRQGKEDILAEIREQITLTKDKWSDVKARMFPISLEDLVKFMQDTHIHGYKKIPEFTTKYTSDTGGLCIMLDEVYRHITKSNIKGRIIETISYLNQKMETEEGWLPYDAEITSQ